MRQSEIQLTPSGGLRHFIDFDGLTTAHLEAILTRANGYLGPQGEIINRPDLAGTTVMNLFFEPSTRTRTTFEVAAKRLSADVINIDIARSSTTKGESLSDMLKNLEAMSADMFVVRHGSSGAARFMAEKVCPTIPIINGGDGWHAHPTQAMLDMLTIQREAPRPFNELSVALIGDIKHSRVARSDIAALKLLGVKDIRVIGPRTLMPKGIERFGVQVFHQMEQGIKDVDVVIALRIQNERLGSALLSTKEEFYKLYGLSEQRLALAKPDAIVMHPGPMNRGVEIASSVADSKQSVILKQVNYGIAVRMAVMAMTHAGQRESAESQPASEVGL